jgi:hypothetical protein
MDPTLAYRNLLRSLGAGHILVGHERRIRQEVRDFLTTHVTNKLESVWST